MHSTCNSRFRKRISYGRKQRCATKSLVFWYLFFSSNMSTANEGPDFATFVRMYKQWGELSTVWVVGEGCSGKCELESLVARIEN